ncbi:4-hydroxy-tetrahydrodipicolinate synthase [Gilvibacter sediminis]|uniref:4-hydroxy-tetrahydrodipicolinate synthase n=1 Tax=Gilvibacter sediminis TaxID=379071 RepID=UPI002350CF15|nr:4-hydroxy-tetrahydrodipicolinate synthase [Gilvibacter sediminis]MDC7997842.1 4-hydroxy-tetrahydrodipicolinate synthase [Gilvibacter sediminis]
MQELIGTGVALITPFDAHGNPDLEALTALVDFNIENGVDYLVVLGTTAESATLTAEEKAAVKACITKANNKRVPEVLGIGGNNTAAVVEELKTTDLSDYAAVLSVSPYYNKPTQEGIYRHFEAVANATDKPIILYNVPGRTSSNMAPETVARLAADFDNVVAIKEAAGDIVQAMELLRLVPEDFLVISGDDMITLPMVLAGGAGVISVIGEGMPAEFSAMVRLARAGQNEQARALQYQLMPVIDMIFEEGNPAGIKALLAHRGICSANVRLPLVEASAGLKMRIADFLKEF